MESYDVVIVGYGPTGCMLALKLGRCGRRVLVLERQEAGYPLPRAATWTTRCAARSKESASRRQRCRT
jgi:choline dehydrogenase-like flavoprotein